MGGGGRSVSDPTLSELQQEQLMHRPGGKDKNAHICDTCGHVGLACLSLLKDSQGFAMSPSHVAWFGLPHSMVAPSPHVSAPGTKAKSALPFLTASKSYRAPYPHSVGY